MKLLLTSSGFTNQLIIKSLKELSDRPLTKLKAVFIPTAANFEASDKSWFINDLVNCQKIGFEEIDIVDILAMPKNLWLPRLKKADVIIVGGGNTFYLMSAINKSGLKQLMPTLLKNKIYVGISAGSAIACPTLDLEGSKNLYKETVVAGTKNQGFAWIDFIIRPHLNSKFCPKMNIKHLEQMAKRSSKTFYAIDDQTAIVVNNNKLKIVSKGQWKKFN